MADIFLSYSREDQLTARRFAESLQREGFEVWWDQTLRSGEAYDEVTENALKSARAVVVLWSRTAVASRWVRAEATIADRKGNLVPAMIEPCERPVMFELRQTAELAHWKGDAGDRAWLAFIDDLRQKLGSRPTPASSVAGGSVAMKWPLPRKPVVVLAVVALLALVGAISLHQFSHKAAVPTNAPVAASAPIKLAVLPFTSLSAGPDEDFPGRLADSLTTQLQQVGPALRVIGQESTEPLAQQKREPREIARLLGVAYLMGASVQREGSEVLVNVRLMDGRDGAYTGPALSYRRKLQDIFALQQEIATDVARKVGILLDITVPRAEGGTNDVAAWEQYQRGVESWRRGKDDVVGFLREAVKQDAEYKQAWHLLYIFRIAPTLQADPEGIEALRREQARAVAQLQKLPLESGLSKRFQALQSVQRHDWVAAMSLSGEAIAISPMRDSLFARAQYLLMLGRVNEGIRFLRLAVEPDPLNQDVSRFLQQALLAAGRDEEAQKEAARIKGLGIEAAVSRFPFLGDRNALIDALQGFPRSADGRFAAGPFAGVLPGDLQDVAGAKQWVASIPPPVSVSSAYHRAQVGISLGAEDARIHPALRRALVDMPEGVFLLRRFWIDGTAAHLPPQMLKSLVRELKLDDYWRKTNQWSDFCRDTGNDFECFDQPLKQTTH